MNRRTLVALMASSLLLSAAGAPVKYGRISAGTASGITKKMAVVITTEEQWRELWKQHMSYMKPAPPPPVIHFANETVLAVFAGQKSSGGYAVKISSIETDGKKLLVKVTVTTPPKGALTTQELIQPFEFVTVAAFKQAASFGDF